MSILSLNNIHTYYGQIQALRGISLTVNEGEIVTLIGTNGAGKTTTLNTISGLRQPRTGEILFQGQRIDRLPVHEVTRRGIVQSPEGRKIFGRMSVRENLEMGAFIFSQRDAAAIRQELDRVLTLFPRLHERLGQPGGTLSGGEQQMLAIGRAMMARPRVLLLDEPSMGLAPVLVDQIFNIIKEINTQGTTILLVEQNALMALGIAHRGYVLQSGSIVLEDTAQNLQENEMVRKAYLGVD
jgi:branched-chain amino acid transport system ATP-binding protein